MASSWTHSAGAVAIAATLMPRGTRNRVWLITTIAAAAPDIDAIGRPFGLGDLEFLGGHRALTHSIAFASVAALLLLTALRAPSQQVVAWLALALAIASHGGLDAMTSYGEGVAFLAPFSDTRYRAPWLLLGDGIVRDTVAFVLFATMANMVLRKRGFALPPALQWPRRSGKR